MSRIQHDPPDEIQELIVEAGPPDPIPAGDLEAIRSAARRALASGGGAPILEGQSVSPIVEGQSVSPIFEGRSSRRLPLALAATLALAAIAVWLFMSTGRPAVEGATVATVELVRGERAAAVGLEAGAEVAAGTQIDTRAEEPVLVALRMTGGHSVRLDADSRVRLESATRLELEHGALYVDSGPRAAGPGLVIGTPLGTVRELGTQYEVRLRGNGEASLRIRVREGSVSLSRDGESHSAVHGEQLTVHGSGAVVRDTAPTTGDSWTWVTASAPSLDTDGMTLAEYLDWIRRETGLEVEFEDPSLEIDATEVMVVGNPARGLTPEQTLDVVLPGFGLDHRVARGKLVVTGPGSSG